MASSTSSFPTLYAQLGTAWLLDTYRLGPARLRSVLDGLTADELRAHPIAGKWSSLEVAMHLADAEVTGAARIRLVLAGDDRLLPGYDEARWANAMRYGEFDRIMIDHYFGMFSALRAATARLLSSASDDDWARPGNHASWGQVTLRQVLEIYVDHSERHIGQILERRELLGKPLAFPLLLPERLY